MSDTLLTACPFCGWMGGLAYNPVTRTQRCTIGCSNEWLTPEGRAHFAIQEARNRERLAALHRAALRSLVGHKVTSVETAEFGGLSFTFSNGARISFSDGWHTLTMAGGEEYSGTA